MTWDIKGEPYEVQSKAGGAARGKDGYAYFMEMGLGKSAVALNEFIQLRNDGKVEHLVITCPNSLKPNWRDEVEKWGVDAEVYLWPKKPKYLYKDGKPTYKVDKPIIWVFNFEAMLFAGGEELLHFIQANPCIWIVDESSKIKNPNAKTTKVMIANSIHAPIRRILTGTPMSQSVMDLWPQLRFIGELRGVNQFAFRNRHAVMGGYMGKQIIGVKDESELQKILSGCAFQAKKKDWTDLPDKVYSSRHVEMTKIQLDAYNEMKRNFLLMLSDATVITAPMVITQLTKLQQISRGFIYDEDHEVQELVDPSRNPCIDVIHEVMDEIEGKLIVFAQHKYSMSALYKALYKYNVARLEGGMSSDEVTAEKLKFNEDSSCRVILSQIGVGGIGHTLLGKPGKDRCSTMLFYENTFSLEKRKQAEDRNHRHGQDETCSYIDLFCSPIDKRVAHALQHKEDIVKAVMGDARDGLL